MLVFLPPIALFIVWKDKKFLKQMALVIFYVSILIILVYLFGMAYVSSAAGYDMPSWRNVLLPAVMPWMVVMTFGLLIAIYAQHAIIKTEGHIRNGVDT